MKTKIKYCYTFLILLVTSVACSDDVTIDLNNDGKYDVTDKPIVAIVASDGSTKSSETVFRNAGESKFYLTTSKLFSSNVELDVEFNSKYLDEYNKAEGTEYELFPLENVTIANGGKATIAANEMKSSDFVITYKTSSSLKPEVQYAIPFKVVSKDAELLGSKDVNMVLLVRDITSIPYANKGDKVKIISCIEANDTNPLSQMSFTLKETGEPFIDMVILFSSNINFDVKTGESYIFHNKELTNILSNSEKYIKPLQERGIKVILSLLGNHDQAGVANLSDEAAKDFALKIKQCCDAYNLDGVFFDDEYSNYPYYDVPAGFVTPSSEAASRLIYETKKVMPEKLVTTYVYGALSYMTTVDGVAPGESVDIAISDYGAGPADYEGLANTKISPWSAEYARGYFIGDYSLQQVISGGYKYYMIFAMDPNRTNFEDQVYEYPWGSWTQQGQLSHMKKLATYFYNDELVFDGVKYPADHK